MTSFSLTEDAKTRTLAIFYDDGGTDTIADNHPSFQALIDLFLSGKAKDDSVRELSNVLLTLANKMRQVSDRVSIQGKKIFFDGDPLRGELADTIQGLFETGKDVDALPLVKFLEKASTNPNLDSIDQLYGWVRTGKLVLTDTGDFLAYKGVSVDYSADALDGVGVSGWSGSATVNGVDYKNRQIPYPLKAVVSMPRSVINADGSVACGVGLHAGTFSYACSYASLHMLLVQINPRDVVSVPKDARGEKLRVRRLVVVDKVEKPIEDRFYTTSIPDGYTGPAEEDQVEKAKAEPVASVVEVKAVPDVVGAFANIRDSKGRFTKAAAAKAVRDAKGRFIKGGI